MDVVAKVHAAIGVGRPYQLRHGVGELPEACLAGAQSLFGQLALGDVLPGAESADDQAVIVGEIGVVPGDQALPPITALNRVLEVLGGLQFTGHDPPENRVDLVHPRWLREAVFEPVEPQQLRLAITQGVATLTINHADPPLGIQGHDEALHCVEVVAFELDLVAQRLFHPFALGDVDKGGDTPAGATLGITQGGGVAKEGADPAVSEHDLHLAIMHLEPPGGLLHRQLLAMHVAPEPPDRKVGGPLPIPSGQGGLRATGQAQPVVGGPVARDMLAIGIVSDPHRRWHGVQDRLQFRGALVGEAARLSQFLGKRLRVTDVRRPRDPARVQFPFTRRARFAAFAVLGGCRPGPLELGNVRTGLRWPRVAVSHAAVVRCY